LQINLLLLGQFGATDDSLVSRNKAFWWFLSRDSLFEQELKVEVKSVEHVSNSNLQSWKPPILFTH